MKRIKGTHKQLKSLTIMLIPNSTAKVRRIHIPYWAFSILGIPILCILAITILFQSQANNLESQLAHTAMRLSETNMENSTLNESLVSVKSEYANMQQEQALTMLQDNEKEQKIVELLAKVEAIDNIKYGIIKVFNDIDALDIPFHFDEKTLSGGTFRAAGGAYSEDIGDIITELDITLAGKMGDMQALAHLAEEADGLFIALPSGWPVKSEEIVSEFGYRVNPITNQGTEWHSGIDIAVPYGTEVYATSYGVVTFAGWNVDGYGNLVIIEHDYDYTTYYAHNSEVLVKVGEQVVRGQLIALSGDSGRSTSPHCHYEVRFDTLPQDPREYLN